MYSGRHTISPKVSKIIPISGKTIHISGKTVPMPGKTIHIAGKIIHISGKTVTIAGKIIHIKGKTIPMTGKTVHIKDDAIPIPGKTIPISEKTIPISEKMTPIPGEIIVKVFSSRKNVMFEGWGGNYEKIVTGNYYYVDKTMYLREIEEAGSYLFFIRPRRFGKSLFLSMMEGYYDVYYKDRFDELFAHTAVHPDPTPEQGAYLVLKFDCSGIAPNIDEIEKSFLNNIRSAVRSFLRKYDSYLIDDKKIIEKDMEKRSAASDILLNVVNLCRDSHQKLYVMIDEYDNFANTILSTAGKHEYERLTHGEGFFRAFFNVLKAGTSGMEAPISRLFLTGVSPITLDDVTSGFNIGENISIDAPFNRILGFTEDDLEAMLEYYQQAGQIKEDPNFLKGIMKKWYNHYLFSPDTGIRLYNADMVLYFLKEYFKTDSVPKDLIDRNVRMDYEKLRYLVTTDRGGRKEVNGNFGKFFSDN